MMGKRPGNVINWVMIGFIVAGCDAEHVNVADKKGREKPKDLADAFRCIVKRFFKKPFRQVLI